VLVLGPIVHEEQQAGGPQALHQTIQQGLGSAVDPVQVLEDHHQRLHLTLPQEQTLDGVEGELAALGRVEGLPGRILDRHVEQRQQRGQQGLERAVQTQHPPQHLRAHLPVIVPLADLEVALEQIDHGQVARGFAVGDGRGFQDQPVLHPMGVGELVDQPRLAHAGLADDRDHLTPPGAGLAEHSAQVLDFGVAADETGEAPEGRGLQARPRRPRPCQLVDLHGLGEPFHRHGTERLHLDVALGQRQRIGRDHDRAGIGELLHPRGQVRRLADGGVIHVEVATNGAHDDLARVEPDADLDDRPMRASHRFRIRLHALLHPERGVARAHRVIFMGERRAEQRHDAVAHDLVHRALVAVYGLHHAFDDGVEHSPGFFRVAVGQELHGSLQVGKQDRDVLALALQDTFGCEDLLGEMLGGVGLGRTEFRLGRRWR
jgi:hypothetical protein